MPDYLITTVKAWLRKLDTRRIGTKQPETDTLAVILEDLPCTITDWLRALVARCEAAEAERDAARAEAAQLVKLFNVDTAELREQRYAALQQRDAARAEVERVRADKEVHERVLVREIAGWKGECADLKTQKESDDYLIESLKGDVEIARAEVARLREAQDEALSRSLMANCLIVPKEPMDDTAMFYGCGTGPVQYLVPHLDGYAIVPRDRYERLVKHIDGVAALDTPEREGGRGDDSDCV